jgi:hypothetical protein
MEWRPVVGYEDYYEVSDGGQVRSRMTRTRGRAGYILHPRLNKDGYPEVNLCVNDKRHLVRVHTLVVRAFLGETPDGKQVNHKNGIKNDNRLENLEFVTPSENRKHAFAIGLQQGRGGEQCHFHKLTADEVLRIAMCKNRVPVRHVAIHFGVSCHTISRIFNRTT